MILLDTHTLLWYITDDPRLPDSRKNEIENEYLPCYISIASIWEIGIKQSLKKLSLEITLDEIVIEIKRSSLQLLPIKISHIEKVTMPPFHHRDPFDRILIAQAQSENLTLISRDTVIATYDVKTSWI